MRTRPVVAWLLLALVACASCGRQGHGTTASGAAEDGDPLPERYRASLLSSVGVVPRPGSITVTYLGTSMLLFDDGETQLLVNPRVSRSAGSTTDGKRIDETLKLLQANRVGAIFVAGEGDRVGDAIYIARRTGATLVGPSAALDVARANGVPQQQLAPYMPGSTIKAGKFRVEQIASKAAPLPKDASGRTHPGGSSVDLLIRKGSRSILVKSSANFLPGALDHVNADVLFLPTGGLAEQSDYFQDLYYRQTVDQVHPKLVVPLQWDDATRPLSRKLVLADGTPAAFDFLMGRLQQDKIRFGLLQGYHTTELFDAKSCAIPLSAEPVTSPVAGKGR
ncbi:hypothetical protein LVB87_11620 [Lysobacter sp. KIS68-7]|uniref:hypothetical protein n=1 Tax=Lysobacter sp. KIS68-7 TaxID=2904252 RepID=UPI001E4F377C|nr:hypothetical protein [Lysobacter sp. KIS68-7]UHQ18829.1 hypothetical protein LVB87_11620 [Lysobacter sp. KIS68-7]